MTLEKKPNIILITFDSTRADRMGVAGYKRNITPFLDSLAQKGAYFKRAFSTGPGSPHSFVAILTSTFPFDYGGFEYIDRPRVIISEVLKAAGYKTIGIHSAVYMSAYFGYDRGWDKFVYLSNFQESEVTPAIRRDSWQSKFLKRLSNTHKYLKRKSPFLNSVFSVIEKIAFTFRKIFVDIFRFRPAFIIAEDVNKEIKKIIPNKPDKPLFLWVHYMDPHGPYALFWKLKGTIIQKIKYFICDIIPFIFGQKIWVTKLFKFLSIDAYDSSIKYTDQNIKNLFEYLSSLDVINDDSLIIICSDHGEEFFEHGVIGHIDTLYNLNLNVPLIIYSPKHLPKNEVIERPVSLIDISPTILNIAGISNPAAFKGRNIFDTEARPIIAQVPSTESDLSGQTFIGASIMKDGYKFIKRLDEKMLFSSDDFLERSNLYNPESEISKKMEKLLEPYEHIRPAK